MKKIKLTIFFFSCLFTSTFSQLLLSDSLLLDELLDNYSSCFSYVDSGKLEVTTTILNTGAVSQEAASFKTVFSRDIGFRFFFEKRNLRFPFFFELIIHKENDNSISTFYKKLGNKPAQIEKKPFSLSIASATGITLNTSYQVPKLLMKNSIIGRELLEGLEKIERLENETFEGNEFYVFKMYRIIDKNKFIKFNKLFKERLKSMPKMKPGIVEIEETFWFEKKSKLLHRIQYISKQEDSLHERNTTFFPTINNDIPDEALSLNLPK